MTSPQRLLFTLTSGRSGTASLAKLLAANLPEAQCHHEILGWDRFGLDSPDLSQMTLFNSQGNVAQVRDFWRRKSARILGAAAPLYAETSHVLMKAGLLENLDLFEAVGEIHFVALERDLFDTLISFRNRYDFTNKSLWWLWYLDPRYPRNIVESRQLAALGINGVCLWYLFEIRARAAYYRQLFGDRPGLHFHRLDLSDLGDRDRLAGLLLALGATLEAEAVTLWPKQNSGQNKHPFPPGEEDAIRRLVASVQFDAEATARDFIAQGRRL